MRLPLAAVVAALPAVALATDFRRDVKPIFAAHCVQCHGPVAQKGGLRLDTAAAVRAGGDTGPAVVPGKSAESPLVLAVTAAEGAKRMPLKGALLAETQVATIKQWIDAGAPIPADDTPDAAAPPPKHWAFVPPKAAGKSIDDHVQAELAKRNLTPSPAADPRTLLRRLALDLTGLPPSPEEVEAFAANPLAAAYLEHVERLLASPHYGERWGRHWLDAARYADSNGYSVDAPREMWKYRDWVIDALNRDLPFDQFTVEQLAGDLLPNATQGQKVATGFHRNTMLNQEGGIDPEMFRIDAVADRVNTTATVFLGLTAGCARCHDHKYDPISTKEYYQLFAVFNNCDEPTLEYADASVVAEREKNRARRKQIEDELRKVETRIIDAIPDPTTLGEVRGIHELAVDKRSEKQKTAMFKFVVSKEPKLKGMVTEHAKLKASEPKFPSALVLSERKTPRETFVHKGGDFARPGDRVYPGTLKVLPPLEAKNPTRLDVARWLVSPGHPLTARVTVNRVWQQYFGRGLVETENDFGTQGSQPSHPALLDDLALDFQKDWSLKRLHKTIVTSATYRQASAFRPDVTASDPTNKYVARQSRIRLEAEIIRDCALVASGKLTRTVGGPSVRPPQPEGVFKFTQVKRDWQASTGPDRFRRGMYTLFWRAAPHPALLVFDAPDSTAACTRRTRSNTPLQALTLLNDAAWVELSQALADRVLKEAAGDDARVTRAVALVLGRSPSDAERGRLLAFVQEQRREPTADAERAAWVAVSRVLMNLDEAVTRE